MDRGIGAITSRTDDAPASGLMFLALLLVLVLPPLPLGSNRLWSWELLHAASMVLLGLWCLNLVMNPRIWPEAISRNWLVIVLLALWALYVAAQSLPLPGSFVAFASPAAFELQNQVLAGGDMSQFSISVDRGATFYSLQKIVSYIALFVLTLALVNDRRRLRIALTALVVIGTVESLYGLIAFLSPKQMGLWHPGSHANAVSGTYVNHNHFAGLIEMSIAAAVGLILSEHVNSHGHGWRGFAKRVADALLRRSGGLSFCLLLMLSALILSASRGGVAALLIGLGVATALAVLFHGKSATESRMLPRVILLSLVAVAWLGAGGLASKIESSGFSSNRGDLRSTTMEIVSDYAPTGSGAGTFQWIFPAYKSDEFGGGYYEHAHNDYLELLSELGLLGLAPLALAMSLIGWRIVKSYARRCDPLVRGAQFAAVAGGTALMAHGLVDFNFQIPANAAMFFVLMGLGLAAGGLKRKHD